MKIQRWSVTRGAKLGIFVKTPLTTMNTMFEIDWVIIIPHNGTFSDIGQKPPFSVIRLVGPSHYLDQSWNIVNSNLWNRFQWILKLNSYIFIKENAYENVFCEIAAILSSGRWVKQQYTSPGVMKCGSALWMLMSRFPNQQAISTCLNNSISTPIASQQLHKIVAFNLITHRVTIDCEEMIYQVILWGKKYVYIICKEMWPFPRGIHFCDTGKLALWGFKGCDGTDHSY